MVYLAVVLSFLTVLMFSYFVFLIFNKGKLEMVDRISSMENMDNAFVGRENQYGESILTALYNSVGGILIKLTPSYNNSKKKKMLEKAGVLRETTAEKWVARKMFLTLFLMIIVVVAGVVMSQGPDVIFLMGVIAILAINVFYRFYLSKRITSRTSKIIKDLPFTLDLITVSVEAGLSLDGAIGRIVSNIHGPLSDEFGITLKEMRMGLSKKEALRNMANRVGNRDLSMLLSSIIQADELGVSLGKILRIEGEQFREKRKQVAKEKAMKAPVKMLFPIIIFIFPSIFIIVLAPAFIHMMDLL